MMDMHYIIPFSIICIVEYNNFNSQLMFPIVKDEKYIYKFKIKIKRSYKHTPSQTLQIVGLFSLWFNEVKLLIIHYLNPNKSIYDCVDADNVQWKMQRAHGKGFWITKEYNIHTENCQIKFMKISQFNSKTYRFYWPQLNSLTYQLPYKRITVSKICMYSNWIKLIYLYEI